MKLGLSKRAITKLQAAVIAVIIIVVIAAAAYAYYTIFPAPTPTPPAPTPTPPAPTPTPSEEALAIMKKLPEYYPKDYWKIIDEAKKEGKLVAYIPSFKIENVIVEFNKLYPFIKVEFVRSPTAANFEKFVSEMTAGIRAVDVVSLQAPHYVAKCIELGFLEEYDSPEYAYYPPDAVVGKYAVFSQLTPHVTLYNKDLISTAELARMRNLPDFVKFLAEKPDLKFGVLDGVLSRAAIELLYMYINVLYGRNATLEYYRALAARNPPSHWTAGVYGDWVGKGEIALVWQAPLFAVKYTGKFDLYPNLAYDIPTDALVTCTSEVAIVKDAPHPNAAKLWFDFLLSKQGSLIQANKNGWIVNRKDIKKGEVWMTLEELLAMKVGWIETYKGALEILKQYDSLKDLWYQIFIKRM